MLFGLTGHRCSGLGDVWKRILDFRWGWEISASIVLVTLFWVVFTFFCICF